MPWVIADIIASGFGDSCPSRRDSSGGRIHLFFRNSPNSPSSDVHDSHSRHGQSYRTDQAIVR